MESLNIKDTLSIMKYGTSIQVDFAGLSDCAFSFLRNAQMEKVGELLGEMLEFFKEEKAANEKNIDELCKQAEEMKERLGAYHTKIIMECEAISQFILLNKLYMSQLDECIVSARQVMPQILNETSDDVRLRYGALEKRVKELELTRSVSTAFGRQMELVRNNGALMADKIQSTLVNALTMWKSRLIIENQTQDIAAQENSGIVEEIKDSIEIKKKYDDAVDGIK